MIIDMIINIAKLNWWPRRDFKFSSDQEGRSDLII